MTAAWTAETTPEAAARRAGGRRHYNAVRCFARILRRVEVMRRMTCQGTLFRHGFQTELARELGVSRATIPCSVLHNLSL